MKKIEREQFVQLVEAHSRSMFRAARAVLDCDADAEDAVGEAVLLAWQKLETLKRPEAVRSWLLKITVRCAYSQRRKQGRVVYLDDLEQVAGTVPALELEGTDLWSTLRQLPEEQRLVLTLYYYEDLTVAEAARVLGVPQGTIKSRLSRGRERLRQILCEEDGYEYQQL